VIGELCIFHLGSESFEWVLMFSALLPWLIWSEVHSCCSSRAGQGAPNAGSGQ
jgi:hypothetical protein